ncbi:MAG: sensor histidine kinase [Anaerolineae bacterium]|nr:sensor histidine kinase [Anaerolineae bacterium]
MVEKLRYWFNPHPDTEGALRLGFIASYIMVIGALVVYTNYVSGCDSGVVSFPLWGIAGLLMLLVLTERFEIVRLADTQPRQNAILLVVLRAVLVQAIVWLDCTGLAIILYPVVPFAAYFSLGKITGRIVGLAYWMFVSANAFIANGARLLANFDRLTITVIFTLLTIFMLRIADLIDREMRRAQHTRELLARLETSHRQLQAYASQVAELATAEERNRLARDIHDSVGHHLTAINIQLEKAIAFRQRDPNQADQSVRDAKASAEAALQDVRESVGALRQGGDTFSLRQSLAELIDRMDTTVLSVDLRVQGDESTFSRPVLTTLYRVAQEGLTNVQKHAAAHHVLLDIDLGVKEARMKLQDDGAGFDSRELARLTAFPDGSFGLQGLIERVELVRGQMIINSDPQAGTELTVVIPRNPAQLPQLAGAA